MKLSARQRTAKDMPSLLIEKIWRCKHEEDIWEAFLLCLKEVMYSTNELENSENEDEEYNYIIDMIV